MSKNKEMTLEDLIAEVQDLHITIFDACDEILSCEQYLSNGAEAQNFSPFVFKYDIANSILRFLDSAFEHYDSTVDLLQNCTIKVPEPRLTRDDELILKLIEKDIQAMSVSQEVAIANLAGRLLA